MRDALINQSTTEEQSRIFHSVAFTKALVERAQQAELTDHLGHGKNELVANESGNTRNGRSKKTLKGDFGELPIEISRDPAGTFEPQIITKHQTRRKRL